MVLIPSIVDRDAPSKVVPLFKRLAEQRAQFEGMYKDGVIDRLVVFEQPQKRVTTDPEDPPQDAGNDPKMAGPLRNGTLTPMNEVAVNPDGAGIEVVLRAERSDTDRRNLWAHLDEEGNLHIDGQDLGSGTALVSSDGEYEWFETIRAEHLPRLLLLLGGAPGDDLLELLEDRWSGSNSYVLEGLLRRCDIPIERFVY
jgi:hypothetical protein